MRSKKFNDGKFLKDIDKIIQNIVTLNLEEYPKQKIEYFLKKTGNIAHMGVIFRKGMSVMRARPNYNGERFTKKSDFSFKPGELNKTYQRASTPSQTMFYGSIIPEHIEKDELDNMRIIGIAETIPMLRDKSQSGIQKISFGRWLVEEDIRLLAIAQEERYYEESNYTRELVSAYKEFIKNKPKAFIDRSNKLQTFLANEFSKEEIKNDYDYMISAIFSELTTHHGFDGILYPSVRVSGKGFNIAITPKATKKMKLRIAGECTIYKQKDQTVVSNDAIISLSGNEQEFELVDLPSQEIACLNELGLKSRAEFIKKIL